MSIVQTISYFDGPCKGRTLKWTEGRVPEEIRCGSPDPVWYVPSLWRSQGPTWVYVVRGGPNEAEPPAEVRGRRDALKAFNQLMRTQTHDKPKSLRKMLAAGRRARRAVR